MGPCMSERNNSCGKQTPSPCTSEINNSYSNKERLKSKKRSCFKSKSRFFFRFANLQGFKGQHTHNRKLYKLVFQISGFLRSRFNLNLTRRSHADQQV